ncbi:transposase [Paenibacillus pinihumi]|uniref:transposase n=1 Tax=Paenibacillus pinihumi TaxID=669462 RepID=UPI00040C851D|nr:transposase [Paenibacillus pinihumi]
MQIEKIKGNPVLAYFYQAKWPQGYCCPRCKHRHAYLVSSRKVPLFQCIHCRHQTSLTVGTVMEHTRIPLETWFQALQRMAQPGGTQAMRLHKDIKVSYKTAWSMLKRIRMAISMLDMEQPLYGDVRAEITFYGQANRANRPSIRRHLKEHTIVAMASVPSIINELDNLNDLINSNSPTTLNTWSETALDVRNQHVTDSPYIKLKIANPAFMVNRRMPEVLQPMFFRRHVHLSSEVYSSSSEKSIILNSNAPGLERVAMQAKHWVNKTFHGIGPRYLQLYWDEFCFRLNCHMRRQSPIAALTAICMQSV